MDKKKSGLELLREPFPANQISKLPKPTKKQTEEVKANYRAGVRCTICGTWHHPDVVHLDYVGHAALTDRLLDADPNWTWEPLAIGQDGYPVIDRDGGMWIKLTVCGVTRLGYGDAQGKTGGDAMKERIGDALRNAAMRFGAALDLWHKGDLHKVDEEPVQQEQQVETLTEDNQRWILDACDICGKDPEEIVKAYRVTHLSKIPVRSFSAIKLRLEDIIKQMPQPEGPETQA